MKTKKQCLGTTQKGKKCKQIDLRKNGYCKYHQYQANRAPILKSPKNKYKTEYHKYLDSPEWKKKKEIVLSILGRTCKLCGKYGNTIHHNTYARVYQEDLIRDLTVLCKKCHTNYHEKGK